MESVDGLVIGFFAEAHAKDRKKLFPEQVIGNWCALWQEKASVA